MRDNNPWTQTGQEYFFPFLDDASSTYEVFHPAPYTEPEEPDMVNKDDVTSLVNSALADAIVGALDSDLRERLIIKALTNVLNSVEIREIASKLVVERATELAKIQIASGHFDAQITEAIVSGCVTAIEVMKQVMATTLVKAVCGDADRPGPGIMLKEMMQALKARS